MRNCHDDDDFLMADAGALCNCNCVHILLLMTQLRDGTAAAVAAEAILSVISDFHHRHSPDKRSFQSMMGRLMSSCFFWLLLMMMMNNGINLLQSWSQ